MNFDAITCIAQAAEQRCDICHAIAVKAFIIQTEHLAFMKIFCVFTWNFGVSVLCYSIHSDE